MDPYWGSGDYNAPRSKGCSNKQPTCPACKGTGRVHYLHKGLDLKADVGDQVVAPFQEAFLTRIGKAYPKGDLASIHLQGCGNAADYEVKILYAEPLSTVKVGMLFKAGMALASAQDVASFHQQSAPSRKPMTNHIHLELRFKGDLVSPKDFLVSEEDWT